MVVLLPVLACTTKAYFLAAQFHSSVLAYVGCPWSPIGAGPRGGFIHHWLIAGRNCAINRAALLLRWFVRFVH